MKKCKLGENDNLAVLFSISAQSTNAGARHAYLFAKLRTRIVY
jgi:hypothetical protein